MAAVAAAAAARARAGWPAARRFTTDAAHALLREYELGREPQVVPFEIDEAEARRRFLAWQSGAARLAPAGLLPEGGAWSLRAALLPFWLFDIAARVEYAGSVGLADRQGGPLAWRQVGWKEVPDVQYGWQDDAALQVYASYKYRRDYAAVAHAPHALRRLQPLPQRDAERGAFASRLRGGGWLEAALDPPAMQQAIAWELALRDMREAEHRAAEQRLLAAHGASAARDVRVALHVRDRTARLAFLPAFHLQYHHGEAFNPHGERVPARFEALIGGTAEGGVAGTRHLSPRRAGGGFAAAALGTTAVAAPLLGSDPWALMNVETGFALLSASYLAGLGARMLPLWARQAGEAARLRASDDEFERVAAMGLGPLDTGSEEQEMLRSAAEWRRWEAAGAEEAWQEDKRAAWAEELFRAQHRRRQERERLREKLEADRARQEEEERREERRRARWGRASHHSFFRAGGGAAGAGFAGGRRGGGRGDHLGHYAALGLEAAAARGPVSEEEIKRAFRRAALRWHPDKQEAGDEAGRRAARERFHAVRAAYDVLRCPDRRRAYDRGEPLDSM